MERWVPYRIHKSLPPVPILSQINPVHAFPSHFLKINFNIIFLCTGVHGKVFQAVSFSQFLLKKILYTAVLSLTCATCPAHLILDLITRITFGREYRSESSSFSSLLYSPVTSSLFGPNIFLSTIPLLLPQCERPSFTPILERARSKL